MVGELDVGAELAGHRIDALVGRGGMGVVYRATQLRLRRTVALKVLAPAISADATFRRRFEREARLAASLDHPHVIPVHEAGEQDGVLYLSMRYVDGADLGGVLSASGPPSLERVCELLEPVAGALDAAHARTLVHLDVKPGNILVAAGRGPGEREHVYLSDFGLTRRWADATSAITGGVVGTPAYMAPERFGGGPCDGAADIYALACVIYRCLSGSVPFPRESVPAVVYAHLHADPPPLRRSRPELPHSVDAAVGRGMAKEPAARQRSCHALLAEVRAAATRELITVRPPDGTTAAGRALTAVDAETDVVGRPEAGPVGRTGLRLTAVGAVLAIALASTLWIVRSTGDLGSAGGHGPVAPDTVRTGFPGVDERAAAALHLQGPEGIAVDAAGLLFVADTNNDRILQVDPAGAARTVVGAGGEGFAGDGGPATTAQIFDPTCVALDATGNLYIADFDNSRVRRIDPAGTITTSAGTGRIAFSGDGGPASEADLNRPYGVVVDASGVIYVADTGNDRVRRIDPSGTITTIAGTGELGMSGDGGPATAAKLDRPSDLAIDNAGNLYIADYNNNRVRRIDPTGTITTVAGDGEAGFAGDGGPATAARLHRPTDVATDAAGNLYVADHDNHRVRRVSPSGTISTLDGEFGSPSDVLVDSAGNVYVADFGNPSVVRRLDTAGRITVVAGGA